MVERRAVCSTAIGGDRGEGGKEGEGVWCGGGEEEFSMPCCLKGTDSERAGDFLWKILVRR
jgi:hypothetical protein